MEIWRIGHLLPSFYRPSTGAQRAHGLPGICTLATLLWAAVGGQFGACWQPLSSLGLAVARVPALHGLSVAQECASIHACHDYFCSRPCCATRIQIPCLHMLALFAACVDSRWLTRLHRYATLLAVCKPPGSPGGKGSPSCAGERSWPPEPAPPTNISGESATSPAEPSSDASRCKPTWMHVPESDPSFSLGSPNFSRGSIVHCESLPVSQALCPFQWRWPIFSVQTVIKPIGRRCQKLSAVANLVRAYDRQGKSCPRKA